MKKNGPDNSSSPGQPGEERLTIPYLPLRNRVVYPGTRGEFIIGREQSVTAAQTALSDNPHLLFVVLQTDMELLAPDPESELYRIGTVCRIVSLSESGDDNTRRIELEGLYRTEALDWQTPLVTVTPLKEHKIKPTLRRELEKDFRSLLQEILPETQSDKRPQLVKLLQAGQIFPLIEQLHSFFSYTSEQQQQLLEHNSDLDRFIRSVSLAGPSKRTERLEKKFTRQVRSRLDNLQTEFMLKEKLKQVQQDLGKTESADPAEELLEQAEQTAFTAEAREKFDRELNRLRRLPEMSPESGTTRSYLEWLLALPWGIFSEEESDLKKIEKELHSTHFGMNDVKNRILEFTAARLLAGPDAKGSIICLVGPPGTGKTSLAHSIAGALQRKFVRISLGGVRDENEIRGHRRTYVNSLPGRIIQHLRKAGTSNPVFLLDEIDKLGNDFRGDPSSALLEVLDPEINSGFIDHFLEVEFDLSGVLFITTANAVHRIPEPLLDRMELIEISGYTRHEKIEIAARHIFPRQLQRNGLKPANLPLPREVLEKIVDNYTREAGVRQLEKQLEKICRKTARQIISGRRKKFPLSDSRLTELLGASRYRINNRRNLRTPGMARGLAWTAAGGELLYIEARALPGNGKLHLTGKLGEVMKESAQAARSFARELLLKEQVELPRGDINKLDIHVHVPAGAIPKDGPSAGATIAVSILSALFEKPVEPDLAMTGEISLLGEILPVGGLKEKVLAAKRYNITQVIIPHDNRPDIEELASEVSDGVTFYYVESMEQVLELTLPGLLPSAGRNNELQNINQ